MYNQKFEITNIAHSLYPYIHRIVAIRDIGTEVKAGDLGGYVMFEDNLSYTPGDDSWVFGDAIAADLSIVAQNSQLRDHAIACGEAYISHGSVLYGYARAEDKAHIRGSIIAENARVSGTGTVLDLPETGKAPVLAGNSVVYGVVQGDVQMNGNALVFVGEAIRNDTRDKLIINGQNRVIIHTARGIFRA